MLDVIARTLLTSLGTSVIFLLGLYTMLWGAWVINPFWDTFSQASLYSEMHATGGEFFWGAFALVTGAVTSWGAIKARPPYIYHGTAAASWHWAVVGTFYFMGDFRNTGGITALFLALLSLCIYLNVKVNYKYDE